MCVGNGECRVVQGMEQFYIRGFGKSIKGMNTEDLKLKNDGDIDQVFGFCSVHGSLQVLVA
jgi:hypothetical protein